MTVSATRSYCLKADIAGLGGEFSIPSGWSDDDILNLILDVEAEIDDLLDTTYKYDYAYTLECDGSGNSLLIMHDYSKVPIISISSVTWREGVGYAWQDGNKWAADDFDVKKWYIEATGKDTTIRFATKSKFHKGLKNYRVIGSFGFGEVPRQIKYLATLLSRERITPGYLNQLHIGSVVWDDYEFTVKTNKVKELGITGYGVLDRIITKYRRQSMNLLRV